MIAKIDSRSTVSRGEIVDLAFDAKHIHLFDATTEMSILARDEGYEVTPENESSSDFIPLTPAEMQAIIEKNKVVTKEEKAAMRREAKAAAKREKAEAKAAQEAAEAEEAATEAVEEVAPVEEAPIEEVAPVVEEVAAPAEEVAAEEAPAKPKKGRKPQAQDADADKE